MKEIGTRVWQEERGLTLLELAVVVAIIGILAALAAVGGAGASGRARGEALKSDANQVQKAVFDYIGQHNKQHYPTIDGCLPGEAFDSQTKKCNLSGNPGSFDAENTLTFKAIIWDKALIDINGNLKGFVPDMLKHLPKHALEHQDATSWPGSRVSDPEGINTGGLRTPSGGKIPVWVLDADGDVHVTVASSAY